MRLETLFVGSRSFERTEMEEVGDLYELFGVRNYPKDCKNYISKCHIMVFDTTLWMHLADVRTQGCYRLRTVQDFRHDRLTDNYQMA